MRCLFLQSNSLRLLLALLTGTLLPAVPAWAQPQPVEATPPPIAPPRSPPARLQSPAEALAEDAQQYARQFGVSLEEAIMRLRAQEESVAVTDRIRAQYRDRLAGISIEHRPIYRIVVLLTGTEPVPPQTILSGGMSVPIVFRTGAAATHEQILQAIARYRTAIRNALPGNLGMGADQRTGELVLMIRNSDAVRHGIDAIRSDVAALTSVPVEVRVAGERSSDLSIEGGARVEGIDPRNGKRYACTTGYVVAQGSQTAVVTAAHCPDSLTYFDPDGGKIALEFAGEWGARYQDVQVHPSSQAQRPLFYVDSNKTRVRTLATWRNRQSTRAGDIVCHRGETSGYSCAPVDIVDFAPPGNLCGGPCDATWVTVTGPSCRGGDSGGPIFLGSTAFGIVKGGSYTEGACTFYYYMSTDYLPAGWTLLHG